MPGCAGARFLVRICCLVSVLLAAPPLVAAAPLVAAPPLAAVPLVDRVLAKENLSPAGQFVTVTLPDTLDLAARAELSLNALTGNSNPDDSFTVYETFRFGQNPPVLGKPGWFLNPANLRALPCLRTMCGSRAGLDVEYEMLKGMLRQIQPDGRMTFPNDAGWPAGTSVPNVNGRLAVALVNQYARDKNRGWLESANLLCKGLDRTAIRIKDRAYYPLECGIDAGGTWHSTNRGPSPIPYVPPGEPGFEQQGYEGSVKWSTVCGPIEALAALHHVDSDPRALDLGTRLVQFALQERLWDGPSSLAYPGNQQGIFTGNFTGNVFFLNALFEWGMAQKSEKLKQMSRQGYELTRRVGILRMGWYPSWIMKGPETYHRDPALHGVCDSGGVAAALLLAVKLTDAGVGDYWDDVDSIVRNQLVEQQFADANLMRAVAGGDPQDVLRRFVGGCGTGEPTAIKPEISGLATAATAEAFYYAWHGITRFDREAKVAQVNLFLNRVSPWLDVESFLPYEGKVILRNKQARTILVRLPMWLNDRLPMWNADQAAVTCKRNGRVIAAARVGRNLLIDVREADVVELSFPVPARTDQYTIHGKRYKIQFRGSTVVDIDNRNTSPGMIPIYQRRAMKGTKAPLHTVRRFIADKVPPPPPPPPHSVE